MVLASCTTITPARPERVAAFDAGASAGSAGSAGEMPTLPLTGYYVAKFHNAWTGPIMARVEAEPTAKGFKANTPPGVAWEYVRGVEGVLGPVFAPFLFPRGMILTCESTLPGEGKAGEGSIGAGSLASLRLRTVLPGDGRGMEAVLKDGRALGVLTFERVEGWRGRDYGAIAAGVERVLRERLYDPSLATSGAVGDFVSDVRRGAGMAHDDLEFLFALGMSARSRIKFSVPVVYPKREAGGSAIVARLANPVKPWRLMKEEGSRVALLRIESMWGVEAMCEGLAAASATGAEGLVVDLRRCFGMDESAFVLGAWLAEREMDAGWYVAGAGRSRAMGGELDGPTVTVGTAGRSDAVESALRESAMVRVRVAPAPGEARFSGPVAVLIGKRTTGTAEAAVGMLSRAGRVRTFGEATAGRPMISPEFEVGEGWVMRVASADLFVEGASADGTRALEPDERVGGEKALERAQEWVESRLDTAR